jgi:tryptophanyl-tRNA synthetase
MKDQPNQIKNKNNKYAFSGGQVTEAEQRELGGDMEKDVSYQYLTFFMEVDEELEKIKLAYQKGEMLTGELKAKCISELQTLCQRFPRASVQGYGRRSWSFYESSSSWVESEPESQETRASRGGKNRSGGGWCAQVDKESEKKLAKERMIAEKKAAKEKAS